MRVAVTYDNGNVFEHFGRLFIPAVRFWPDMRKTDPWHAWPSER